MFSSSALPGQAFVSLGYEAQRQHDSVAANALRWRAAWLDLGARSRTRRQG
ncbi:MAG: hypothetical protein JNL30_17710 [Rubrivivax sp.]|nr:hypothetical protein [Rubrivivax sp.]